MTERKMSAVACTAFHGLCPEGKLGNGIISVDGIEFIAHKMILSSCSPYFRALFSSSWSNAERKVYQIPGTSSEMMRLLMEYAYTGTVPLTDDNVECLLIAADQFNVLDIVRLCCEFLKSQMCLENCIGIWRFTGYHYCPDLREAAHEFILHHFEEVTRVSTEFLALSFNELECLLEKDELPVKEEAVFEAVLKWVAHDLQSRRQHVVVLLGKEGWKTVNSTSARPPQPRLPPILMSPISSSFALVPFRSTAVGVAEVPQHDENLCPPLRGKFSGKPWQPKTRMVSLELCLGCHIHSGISFMTAFGAKGYGCLEKSRDALAGELTFTVETSSLSSNVHDSVTGLHTNHRWLPLRTLHRLLAGLLVKDSSVETWLRITPGPAALLSAPRGGDGQRDVFPDRGTRRCTLPLATLGFSPLSPALLSASAGGTAEWLAAPQSCPDPCLQLGCGVHVTQTIWGWQLSLVAPWEWGPSKPHPSLWDFIPEKTQCRRTVHWRASCREVAAVCRATLRPACQQRHLVAAQQPRWGSATSGAVRLVSDFWPISNDCQRTMRTSKFPWTSKFRVISPALSKSHGKTPATGKDQAFWFSLLS
ncbi:uncharacterized protein LOC141737442 [Larus michahellis]|uniref:uncharacterized protein LOC141737442 n=1 Tax=Larus michahellis TaxID=119627 RepID=UPI003D9B0718